MKIKSLVFSAVLLGVGLFAGITSAEAYETTAIPLSPTHTLLITTFNVIFRNSNGTIPMTAQTNTKVSYDPLIASFTVYNGDSAVDNADPLSALILSSQPIENSGYTVKAGEKSTFMLITVVPNASYGNGSLSAHLISLPMIININGKINLHAKQNY